MRAGVRIGVDVGAARVGVAASDSEGRLATPVATLARDVAGLGDVDEVVDLAGRMGAIEVVVGLPRRLSGDEGPAAAHAREYARTLAARLGPVHVRLVDERLTTVDAHRTLRESGVQGRDQRRVVDQAAAVLILQTALDMERTSGRPPGERVRSGRRTSRTKDRGR